MLWVIIMGKYVREKNVISVGKYVICIECVKNIELLIKVNFVNDFK